MSTAYKQEPEILFPLQVPDVLNAVCGDPTRCTLGRAGLRILGYIVHVVYDDNTGEVVITWKDSGNRRHRGILEETKDAVRVLWLTDQNKRKLVRRMSEGEQIDLMITKHGSRSPEHRTVTPEQRLKTNERSRELKELRKANLAPPPKRRAPSFARSDRGVRYAEAVKVSS